MKGFEEAAPGPEVVADAIVALVRHPRPPLRRLVTREARFFTFLRWLLPASWNEYGARRGFQLDG